jgi:hypothetical protein
MDPLQLFRHLACVTVEPFTLDNRNLAERPHGGRASVNSPWGSADREGRGAQISPTTKMNSSQKLR